MEKVFVQVVIVPETCCSCGAHFGIDSDSKAKRHKDGNVFYCPNGHELIYNIKPDETKNKLIRAAAQLEASERRERELRSRNVVTRLKNRASRGICPCCDKEFSVLKKHMKSQHPGYEQEAIDGE